MFEKNNQHFVGTYRLKNGKSYPEKQFLNFYIHIFYFV